MSMTFDEYIEKRVHQVSVEFANALWDDGVRNMEKIAKMSKLPLEEVKELFADRIASTTE